MTDKQRLRQAALAARRELPLATVETAGRALAEHLWVRPEWFSAQTIHIYLDALPGELPTNSLVKTALAEGRDVLIPVVVKGGRLRHHHLTDLTDLRRGSFGLWVPRQPRWVQDFSVIDLILVPGAVFDRHGYRVGLGGGYYDRLLSRLPDTTDRVGLIYDQWLYPQVPTEPHDEPVDLIITECAVYPVTPTSEVSS